MEMLLHVYACDARININININFYWTWVWAHAKLYFEDAFRLHVVY